MRYFGERWAAPILADPDVTQAETPVGQLCLFCRTAVGDGDRGLIYDDESVHHRECALRGVLGGIGHLVNHLRYCVFEGNPDAGLPYRQSAQLVWDYVTEARRVTEDELDALASAVKS